MRKPEYVVLHPDYVGIIAGYLDKNLNIVYPRLSETQEGNHLRGVLELVIKAIKGEIIGKPSKKAMSIKCVPFSCYGTFELFDDRKKRRWNIARNRDVKTLGELLSTDKPEWKDPDYQEKIAELFAAYQTVEAVANQIGTHKSTLARWNKKLGQRWYS